ncbi:MAG: Clp protease N-terminal domain-containing protein [Verrucomicrobiota bacterium]
MLSWLTGSNEFRQHPVFKHAEDQARQLRHGYIGSEHLLIGVLVSGGAADRFLADHGLSEDSALEAVREIVGEGERPPRFNVVPATPRAKRIYSRARSIAKRHSDIDVAWQHILMSILEDGNGVGAYILRRFGIDSDSFVKNLEGAAECE